ncbi:UMP kinase [Thiotrichales bacterium 19S9-12]|nr:UMP kinase [Thiotrichales bacterium 19S9-11]MCF6811282.1 UMP kinase [Thiotrichales bacterium 19S9-12]
MEKKYKRILLKLSGEALSEQGALGLSTKALGSIASAITQAVKSGIEVAVVVGGGNFIRGAQLNDSLIDRATADQMGMLATMINALALRDSLHSVSQKAAVLSSRGVESMILTSTIDKARSLLAEGYVVLFAGGTGNPFVTTDSTASLRAIEINADAILKATTVDGVYNKDPKKHSDAQLFDRVTFDQVLKKELKIMDLGAFAQCRDFGVEICVFNLFKDGSLNRVLLGEPEGTWVVKE